MRLCSCRGSTVLFRCVLHDRYFETWVSFLSTVKVIFGLRMMRRSGPSAAMSVSNSAICCVKPHFPRKTIYEMQVQRQPNLAEIKRVTNRENLRTSQICEPRRKIGQERGIPEGGLAVLRESRPFEAVFID